MPGGFHFCVHPPLEPDGSCSNWQRGRYRWSSLHNHSGAQELPCTNGQSSSHCRGRGRQTNSRTRRSRQPISRQHNPPTARCTARARHTHTHLQPADQSLKNHSSRKPAAAPKRRLLFPPSLPRHMFPLSLPRQLQSRRLDDCTWLCAWLPHTAFPAAHYMSKLFPPQGTLFTVQAPAAVRGGAGARGLSARWW